MPFDDEAPTAPADLTAQVASQSRVDLSWTASTDNVGVTNYEIYRDGQLLDVVGNVDDLRRHERQRRDSVRVHGAGRSTRRRTAPPRATRRR